MFVTMNVTLLFCHEMITLAKKLPALGRANSADPGWGKKEGSGVLVAAKPTKYWKQSFVQYLNVPLSYKKFLFTIERNRGILLKENSEALCYTNRQ